MSKSNRWTEDDDYEVVDRPCAHKRAYHSEQAAVTVMNGVRTFRDQWTSDKFPTRAYQCVSGVNPCWLWHLTSAPQHGNSPKPSIFAFSG